MTEDPGYVFVRRGRSSRAALIVAATYAALLAVWVGLEAAPWVLAILALPTLPALWDLWRDPRSGLRLSADRLDWQAGTRGDGLALTLIDRVRIDLRWDRSARVTVILRDGQRQRLPDAALPPAADLQRALQAHGVATERHPFALF
jgi:hypothetical protein